MVDDSSAGNVEAYSVSSMASNVNDCSVVLGVSNELRKPEIKGEVKLSRMWNWNMSSLPIPAGYFRGVLPRAT